MWRISVVLPAPRNRDDCGGILAAIKSSTQYCGNAGYDRNADNLCDMRRCGEAPKGADLAAAVGDVDGWMCGCTTGFVDVTDQLWFAVRATVPRHVICFSYWWMMRQMCGRLGSV
jgi:hypothetical protein